MFFVSTATSTPAIYTLSLHDALPIFHPIVDLCPPLTRVGDRNGVVVDVQVSEFAHVLTDSARVLPRELVALCLRQHDLDRKSTRLNSSHLVISYAVFCLKKKKSY